MVAPQRVPKPGIFNLTPSSPATAQLSPILLSRNSCEEKEKKNAETDNIPLNWRHRAVCQGHSLKMSKLSPSLKALINAPFARPDPTAAPARMREVYKAIANDAAKRNVGFKPWVVLSVRPLPHPRVPVSSLRLSSR